MPTRLIPLIFVVAAALVSQATAQVVTTTTTSTTTTLPLLCPPTQDPCTMDAPVAIPVGVYDIRPRSLVVTGKLMTITGSGELAIFADNITLQPGARFVTASDGTAVTLDAAGTLELQTQGTTKSKIDASGTFDGGTITLHSVGRLAIAGALLVNASDITGCAGSIFATSDTADVSVTDLPGDGIRAVGGLQCGGGFIDIEAPLGSIRVSTQLAAKGGDCSACEIDLLAGGDVSTTAQGVVDLEASGSGDGGLLDAEAGGSITIDGDILANGSGTLVDGGGAGGEADLLANTGSVTVNGRVELNGASPDGDGGANDFEAHTVLTQNGPLLAKSTGFGSALGLYYYSDADIVLAGEVDLSGDEFGGDLEVQAGGQVTVSGTLHSTAPIDPLNDPAAQAGRCEIDACRFTLASTGQLICTGPGPDPEGSNHVNASTGMTIAGTLTATAQNTLAWRTTAPTIVGTAIVDPPPTIVQDPTLPCCGVDCPTTTTTTTSQPTTSIPTASTTSTTSQTGTTSIASTTTTATTPAPTTTSAATIPPTSSTTAVRPTTSTLVPSSSSSTTVTSGTVTSTTAPPAPCSNVAPGVGTVRCQLDELMLQISRTADADLGGKRLAHRFASRITKARALTNDPTTTGHLKKAARQLRAFSAQLRKALDEAKVRAGLAATLSGLAGEAASELSGLITGG